MLLIQITTPHFCAGILVHPNGHVVQAAPCFAPMVGKAWENVRRSLDRQGYTYFIQKQKAEDKPQ